MTRLHLGFLVLACSSPALAIEPPRRFDFEPSPPPTIHFVSDTKVLCAGNLFGCSYTYVTPCIIILRGDFSPSVRAAILRHEKAHCNGWPADHPE